jgi:hypothetical protein
MMGTNTKEATASWAHQQANDTVRNVLLASPPMLAPVRIVAIGASDTHRWYDGNEERI